MNGLSHQTDKSQTFGTSPRQRITVVATVLPMMSSGTPDITTGPQTHYHVLSVAIFGSLSRSTVRRIGRCRRRPRLALFGRGALPCVQRHRATLFH